MAAQPEEGGVLLTELRIVEDKDVDEEDDENSKPVIVPDLNGSDFRTRSAHLYADPKMKELKNFIKSHRHEERLRVAADLEERVQTDSPKAAPTSPKAKAKKEEAPPKRRKSSIRSEGCPAVDRHMKRLASERALLPHIGGSYSDDAPLVIGRTERNWEHVDMKDLAKRKCQMRKMDVFSTRLQWRSSMDYSLRRLLVDLELARDERLKEYSNQARCENLDKMYDWYTTMGMKEARKERIAPPYIRFRGDGVVMAGSLRPVPMKYQVSKPQAAPSQSASAPSLGVAGSGD